jgi:uncharacterized cupin superfamily protein
MPVTIARLELPLPRITLPQHEILEGSGDAGGQFTAESADAKASAGFWSCGVGRYEFYFGYDEFVYIIRGAVAVLELGRDDARELVLGPGDTAHFPQGVTTVWRVTEPLTKYFVAREPF